MDYDFIEIGTSDFDTLIELANDSTIGLSIEPIVEYLNRLPNKAKVKKINAAISIDGTDSPVDIFYVDPLLVDEFYPYIRGCNRVGSCHPLLLENSIINQNKEKYIKRTSVNQITFKELYKQYDIRNVNTLKIDTEGFDCAILNLLLDYLNENTQGDYPNEIIFETNFLTDKSVILQTIERFINVGYNIKAFTWNKTDGTTTLAYKEL